MVQFMENSEVKLFRRSRGTAWIWGCAPGATAQGRLASLVFTACFPGDLPSYQVTRRRR
jgi:hypothetical protein